jgi:5-(carboxyamino)imidazole ribonucleotide synthase
VAVYCPERDAPAVQVASRSTIAAYDDTASLTAFGRSVDVITCEFENIPAASLQLLGQLAPVRPGAGILAIAQDRHLEKEFARSCGAGTATWRTIDAESDIAPALADLGVPAKGVPAILKSRRLGYDGKGQARIADQDEAAAAFRRFGAVPCIVESLVPFQLEISVIVARGQDGAMAVYDPVENRHANHILARTVVPAQIGGATAKTAQGIATTMAERLGLIGLLAVEMFVTAEGGVLVNEIAPRPHNSGHWSIEAAATSQFEQLVRAICGLPLGSTARLADAVMDNLLSDDAARWLDVLRDPSAKLHLYGKTETRPGRKMGHVTKLFPLGSLKPD